MQLKGNFERVWFYLELGFVVLNLVLSKTWFCRLELGTKESDPPFALQLLGRTCLETKAPSSPSSLSGKEFKQFLPIITIDRSGKDIKEFKQFFPLITIRNRNKRIQTILPPNPCLKRKKSQQF